MERLCISLPCVLSPHVTRRACSYFLLLLYISILQNPLSLPILQEWLLLGPTPHLSLHGSYSSTDLWSLKSSVLVPTSGFPSDLCAFPRVKGPDTSPKTVGHP